MTAPTPAEPREPHGETTVALLVAAEQVGPATWTAAQLRNLVLVAQHEARQQGAREAAGIDPVRLARAIEAGTDVMDREMIEHGPIPIVERLSRLATAIAAAYERLADGE